MDLIPDIQGERVKIEPPASNKQGDGCWFIKKMPFSQFIRLWDDLQVDGVGQSSYNMVVKETKIRD